MDWLTSMLTGMGGLGGGILTGILGQNQQDWYKNALMNVLSGLYSNIGTGVTSATNAQNAANPTLQLLQQLGQSGVNTSQALTNYIQNALPGVSQSYQGLLDQNGFSSALSNLLPGSQGYDRLNQLLSQNGVTNAGQQALDRAQQAAQGGTQPQAVMQDLASWLMGTRTNPNNFLQNSLDRATQVENSGGITNPLQDALNKASSLYNNHGVTGLIQQLANAGSKAMSNGGLTPQGVAGENSALNTINSYGANSATDALTNRGLQLLGVQPTISLDQAASNARNEWAQQFTQAARDQRAKAAQRGVQGAQISGLGDMGEFMDQALRGESSAVNNAVNNQQGLLLQQLAQGGNLANAGLGQATSRYGVGSNLLQGLESIANQRYGIGTNSLGQSAGLSNQNILEALGIIPQIQNSATNVVGTYGNLGQGASNTDTARLGLANNSMNDLIGSMLGGTQALTGANSANNGFLAQLLGLNQSGTNDVLGSLLGQGNLNLGAANGSNNSIANLLNIMNSGAGQQLSTGLNASNSFLDQMKSWLGYAGTGLAGISHLFSMSGSPANPLGASLSNLLNPQNGNGGGGGGGGFWGSIPGIINGIGNIFNGGGGGMSGGMGTPGGYEYPPWFSPTIPGQDFGGGYYGVPDASQPGFGGSGGTGVGGGSYNLWPGYLPPIFGPNRLP